MTTKSLFTCTVALTLFALAPAWADSAVKDKAQGGIGGYVAIIAVAKLCDFTVPPATMQIVVANINALQAASELSDKDIDGLLEGGVAGFAKDKAKYCDPGPAVFEAKTLDMAAFAVKAAEGTGIALQPLPRPGAAPATPVAPAAPAVALITGADVEAIAAVARGQGEATVTKDNNGDPKIKGRSQGANWSISFYGCDKGAGCTSIEFYYGFETSTKPTAARINEWNQKKRWGKAYTDKDADPNMTFDIDLRGGVTRANLDAGIRRWVDQVTEFKAFFAK